MSQAESKAHLWLSPVLPLVMVSRYKLRQLSHPSSTGAAVASAAWVVDTPGLAEVWHCHRLLHTCQV